MNIGTLAKRSGLAPSRIRYYERAGILKTVQRKANGYRSYPEETLVVLGLITTAQAAGFSSKRYHPCCRQTSITGIDKRYSPPCNKKWRISKSWNRNSRTVKRNWSTLSMRYNRSRMTLTAPRMRGAY